MTTAPLDLAKPRTLALPDPTPIKTIPYSWTVKDGKFCLSAKGYEALAKNAAQTMRWIEEAKWRLDHYRRELAR